MSEGVELATQQTNALCTGVVVTTETTGSFCSECSDADGNVQYSCTAVVKAPCQLGRIAITTSTKGRGLVRGNQRELGTPA
jgi:hypothetical protein